MSMVRPERSRIRPSGVGGLWGRLVFDLQAMPSARLIHITLGLASVSTAYWFGAQGAANDLPCAAFGVLAAWQLVCAASASSRKPPTVLRLGGFEWDLFTFCRGWLITGQTGSGKTLAAINRLLWQISRNCPNWGGVCVDDKGVYWETLSSMLHNLGRAEDLILL